MLAFIIRRLLQTVLVMPAVVLVAFLLFQYVGDPVVGQDATPEDRARLRAEPGLDQPFFPQFATFVGSAMQGDFGISLRQGRSVLTLIQERLPATLELAFTGANLAIVSETVFQWPERGLPFIPWVQFADIPVAAAYLCLIALVFGLINLMVDLSYFAADPRLLIDRAVAAH